MLLYENKTSTNTTKSNWAVANLADQSQEPFAKDWVDGLA